MDLEFPCNPFKGIGGFNLFSDSQKLHGSWSGYDFTLYSYVLEADFCKPVKRPGCNRIYYRLNSPDSIIVSYFAPLNTINARCSDYFYAFSGFIKDNHVYLTDVLGQGVVGSSELIGGWFGKRLGGNNLILGYDDGSPVDVPNDNSGNDVYFSILSILIFLGIIAACIRLFIYPFWRKIRK